MKHAAAKRKARLENWIQYGPEIGGILRGEVYGHGNFIDGEKVTTSGVISLKDGVAETKNTFYTLGEPYEHIPCRSQAD